MRRIWESDLLRPLSAPARAMFIVIAGGMAVTAVALYVIDLFGEASSTGGLVFIVLPVYAGIAYGLIFLADRLVRFAVRRSAPPEAKS